MATCAATAQAETAARPEAELALAAASVNVSVLDDLMVTARRRGENVQDVPIAITAVSGDLLAKNDQIRLAQDVVAFAPNINAVATDLAAVEEDGPVSPDAARHPLLRTD